MPRSNTGAVAPKTDTEVKQRQARRDCGDGINKPGHPEKARRNAYRNQKQ